MFLIKQTLKEFFNKHKPAIVLIFTVSLTFIVSYFLLSMTGFVVGDATSQLQKELNETKDSLNECVTELVQCATNTTECLTELNSTSQDLAETEETLVACETTLEKREEDIQVLTNVLKQCNVEVTTLQTDYEELMQNSVKYVCCSVADVDNNVTKYWDMVGNKIVCNDGNREIDCKTGELS